MATASSTSLYFMTMSLLVSATSAGVLEAVTLTAWESVCRNSELTPSFMLGGPNLFGRFLGPRKLAARSNL
eukprot:6282375-Amphidinium_carterae.1